MVVPNFSIFFYMLFLVEMMLSEWEFVQISLMFTFAIQIPEGVWA